MKLHQPNIEQARAGLRALKCVFTSDGVLNPIEEKLLAAVQRYITRTDFDISALEPITPAELAAGLPPRFRPQFGGAMVVMSFASGEAGPAQLEAIEAYAGALEVDVRELRSLRLLSERRLAMLRFDVLRHMYIGEGMGQIWHDEGVQGLLATMGGMLGLAERAALAERFRGLGELPEGTVGRALFEFYRSQGFALPGEKYGGPEKMALHDLVHVLSGYGTDPAGEFEVAAFTAGFRREQSFTILLFVLCQFDLGIRIAPVDAPAQIGLLDPDRLLAALTRGARMTVDIFDDWDFWAHAGRPLDELRAAYGIHPK